VSLLRALAVGGAALAVAGCPPKAAEPETSGTAQDEDDDPTRSGLPWRPGDGRLVDPDAGLAIELPPRWEVRPGSDPYVWEARDPAWWGTWLRLGRWDGDSAAQRRWRTDGGEGWLATGPWSGLERLADGPIEVGSRDGEDGGLVVAWWFEVDGRGVFVEAGLPANGFERSWDVVDEIVRSTRRLEER